MKLRAPIHSVDARGRFAQGLVLAIWRGIHYARTFVIPPNPQTFRQIAVRRNLIHVAREWGFPSPAQRQAWEDFAVLMGSTDPETSAEIRWTGITAYIWVNTLMRDAGMTMVADPPVWPMPVELPGFAVAPGPGPGEATATWVPLPIGSMVDLWSMQIPQSRKILKRFYKHQIYLDGGLGTFTFTGGHTGWEFSAKGRYIRVDGGRSALMDRGDVIIP